MQPVGKGKNYFFGMKLHIGVDSHWGLAHSACGDGRECA